MSAEISPLMVRSPAAARPLWLRLRRSQPFTLTVIMCCLALLWVSPFIWMLATSFSTTTFGEDMASLLPRLPLTLDNFRDAWDSADWLNLYANTLIFTFGTFFVQLLTITTAGYVFACHEFRGKKTLFLLFLVQLMIMPVVMMVPNMLTQKNLRPAQHFDRRDDALLHLGVRRVSDAPGVPRHPERAGRGGADGGMPLVAGVIPRTAADVLAIGAGLRHRQHYLPLERVPVAADDAQRSR